MVYILISMPATLSPLPKIQRWFQKYDDASHICYPLLENSPPNSNTSQKNNRLLQLKLQLTFLIY